MELLNYVTYFNVSIYLVLCVLPIWTVIYKCKKFEGTPQLNAKYWPFVRTDYKYWGYLKCALMNIVFLFPIRYAIPWIVVLIFTTLAILLMCGHRKG